MRNHARRVVLGNHETVEWDQESLDQIQRMDALESPKARWILFHCVHLDVSNLLAEIDVM